MFARRPHISGRIEVFRRNSSWVVFTFLPKGRASFLSEEFRLAVIHVDQPGTVEDMTGGGKSRWDVWWMSKIEKRPKSQEHAPAFVSDGRPASPATEFTREYVAWRSGFGVVEMEIVDATHETHVGFVEDDGPLKRRTVQELTLDTVADLRIDRVGTDFEGDRATEALSAVCRRKPRVVRVWRRVPPTLVFGHHGPEHITTRRGD
jgi:hypothetical protein